VRRKKSGFMVGAGEMAARKLCMNLAAREGRSAPSLIQAEPGSPHLHRLDGAKPFGGARLLTSRQRGCNKDSRVRSAAYGRSGSVTYPLFLKQRMAWAVSASSSWIRASSVFLKLKQVFPCSRAFNSLDTPSSRRVFP